MKLISEQTDEASLLGFGQQAVSLLERRDFQSLAAQFDYSLKFDRSAVAAIEEAFQSCLAEFHALSAQHTAVQPSMVVKYFKPNSSNVFAVVECVFTAAEGCPILVELVVTSSGEEKHVTLEEVSLAKV